MYRAVGPPSSVVLVDIDHPFGGISRAGGAALRAGGTPKLLSLGMPAPGPRVALHIKLAPAPALAPGEVAAGAGLVAQSSNLQRARPSPTLGPPAEPTAAALRPSPSGPPVALVVYHLASPQPGAVETVEPFVTTEVRHSLACPFCSDEASASRRRRRGCGGTPEGLMRHLEASHGELLRFEGRRDRRDPAVHHVAVLRRVGVGAGAPSEPSGAGPRFAIVSERRAGRLLWSAGGGAAEAEGAPEPAAAEGGSRSKRRAGSNAPGGGGKAGSKGPVTKKRRNEAAKGSAEGSPKGGGSGQDPATLAAVAAAVERHGARLGGATFERGALLPVRQYYHSRTGVPMAPHEMDFDSDDEIDDEWALTLSESAIDEFEDVSAHEKLFMKLWNRHMRKPTIFADAQIPEACHHFALLQGKVLNEAGLRYNFLLHLLNLWDNSLVAATHISHCKFPLPMV